MNAKRVDQNHENMFSATDESEAESALKVALIRELRKREMTYAKFSRLYIDHYIGKGHSRSKMITDRNNLIASMLGSRTITYDKFIQIFRDILQVNLVSIQLVTMDRDGEKSITEIDVKTF